MTKALLAAAVVTSILMQAPHAQAECEEALVKDAISIKYRDDIRTAVFQMLTDDNFARSNAEGSVAVLLPEIDLPVGAKFANADEKKRAFSNQYGYSFSNVSALDYAATRLSAEGRLAYVECLKSKKPGIKAYVGALADEALSLEIDFTSMPNLAKAFNVTISVSSPKQEIKLPSAIPGGGHKEVIISRDSHKTMLIAVNSATDKVGDVATADRVVVPKDLERRPTPPVTLEVAGSYGNVRGSGHCLDSSDGANIAKCTGKNRCSFTAGASLCSDGKNPSPGDQKTLNIRVSCGMQSGNRAVVDGQVIDVTCPPLSIK